jgi:hypothetical protein
MEFDYTQLIYLLLLLSFLVWQYFTKRTVKFNKKTQLIHLLDKAERVISKYSGGYSGVTLSAEEFHQELKISIQKFKSGDPTQLNQFRIWFAPTFAWDDFVGQKGQELGNQIFELIEEIKKEE